MNLTQKLLFTPILLAGLAQANIVQLAPVSDGDGTIGAAIDYQVFSGTITTDNSGNADIVLLFNYRVPGNNNPSTALGQYQAFGFNLNLGDLLFQVGSEKYGIALTSHSGAPNSANSSGFASVTQGHFYETDSLLTAQTVLNNPSNVHYRNNSLVWLGGNVTDLGALTQTVTYLGSSGPEYKIELTGALPQEFLADVNAHQGFQVEFASATCGNGYMTGSFSGSITSTPEPVSSMLIGSGLLGLSFLRKKRAKRG